MYNKKMAELASIICEQENTKDVDQETILYGMSTLAEVSLSVATTIALGYILGVVWESIFFLMAFSFIRSYAGGYHSKSATRCYFLSSGVMFLALSIIKCVNFQSVIYLIALLVCIAIYVIVAYAPSETENRLLDKDEQKYFRKKAITNMGIEVVAGTALYCVGFKKCSFIITLAIILSSILVIVQKIYKMNLSE